jgi:3-deoxy-D-manno-octulosonic-acid transferase
MRLLYTFLFYISLPFVFLRLLWQSRKNKHYAERWSERLGFISQTFQNTIWIHAVSLGETIAATPLIKKLQQDYPETAFIITTTTPTGAACAQANFKETATHFYLPYDVPCALNQFIKKIQPQLLIIMETELWPNLLHICRQKQIPIFLANARLSEKSARGYGYFGQLTKEMLQSISVFAIQTQKEAERFKALGADSNKIHVTGNIKFDLEIPLDLSQRAAELKKILGEGRPIWVAASTHENEEKIILQAHAEILKTIPDCLLILVPRHRERFKEVETLCHQEKFAVVLRTENQACTPNTQVFLGDTMGELLLFYAVAELAFVGGSLVKVGGHNPLEPAALGLPVLMGSHVFNFESICEALKKSNALLQIEDTSHAAQSLAEKIIALFNNPVQREAMGQQAREFVLQNRGSLVKHIQLIKAMLANSKK